MEGQVTNGTDARAVAAQSLPGEEDLRFIRNFHDIFLSIGIVMFVGGLSLATSIALGPIVRDTFAAGEDGWRSGLKIIAGAGAALAVAMWLMAEFFARGRRLFLPSIVILLAFVFFFEIAVGALYGAAMNFDSELFKTNEPPPPGAASFAALAPILQIWSDAAIVVYGATALAIFVFYARMKLPFAMGLGAATLTVVAFAAAVKASPDRIESIFYLVQLASGFFLFLLGVYFDGRDPERRTRLSDNAFWLHFFAAPTILNSAIGMAVGPTAAIDAPIGASIVILLIVFAFAFVSLLINRRALLVAGLLYALWAAGFLISKTGLSEGWTIAVTLLILGGSMVLLGGGWHSLRRAVVAPFPKTGLIARIVPPEPSKDERRRVSE